MVHLVHGTFINLEIPQKVSPVFKSQSLSTQKFFNTSNISNKRENTESKKSGLISLGEMIGMQATLVEASNRENATFMETVSF